MPCTSALKWVKNDKHGFPPHLLSFNVFGFTPQ